MTTHSRAKKGGEYGANGEWYEGGKFIATTDRPKSAVKIRGSRKIEIEPRVWVESTEASIYNAIKWDVKIVNNVATTHSMSFRGHDGVLCSDQHISTVKNLIEKYNRGERWIG